MNGELTKPGKYPPDANAIRGCATPLSIPAIARNQAAKNPTFRADRSNGIDPIQIAISPITFSHKLVQQNFRIDQLETKGLVEFPEQSIAAAE